MFERDTMKSINKSNPTEEVKNTNYRMHKGKKNWEEDNNQSLVAAINTAISTLNDEADSVKDKINSDLDLSTGGKAAQFAFIDRLVNDAKTKVQEATDLKMVKVILDSEAANISNCYQSGDYKQFNSKKYATKKRPVVDRATKPATEKLKESTYNGLSSFFKAPSKAEKREAITSTVNGNKENEVREALPGLTTINDIDETDSTSAENADISTTGKNIDLEATANVLEEDQRSSSSKFVSVATIYEPERLDNTKISAKAEIDAEVSKVCAMINTDSILSETQKYQQEKNAQRTGETVKSNIDSATNSEGVEQALDLAKQFIRLAYVAGTLQDAKDNAEQSIVAEAGIVKKKINADNLLTVSEKNKQKQDVDKAVADASAAINEKVSIEEVSKAIKDGKVKTNATYVPGKDLNAQKAIAKGKIASEASIVKSKSDTDQNLTTSKKNKQKQDIDRAVTDANDAINAARTLSEISEAVENSKVRINTVYEPGKDLNTQKTSAKQVIVNEASIVKSKINADENLTTSEKNVQKQHIGIAVTDANDAINAAAMPDAIVQAVNDNRAKINTVYVKGKKISAQKISAKQEIVKEANIVKSKIVSNQNLTTTEKNRQKQAVDKKIADVNSTVDAVMTPDEIVQAVNNGKIKINIVYEPGKDLNSQKTCAKQEIADKASIILGEIDADQNLTRSEKNRQKQNLDVAVAKINIAIEVSTTPDEVVQAATKGNAKIDTVYEPGKDLDTQRSIAKQKIASEAVVVKGKIDRDQNLITAEKVREKQDVDRGTAEANVAIEVAETPDAVVQAINDGKANVNAAYVPGKDLGSQKTSAKQKIANSADSVNKQIDADQNLTEDEKSKQKKDVAKTVIEVHTAIDLATGPDEIIQAIIDGKNRTDAAYVLGKDLTAQKASAKDKLDQVKNEVKIEIDSNITLTNSEKTSQKGKVDKDAVGIKQRIDLASDAQGIKDAYDQGIANIKSDHKSSALSMVVQKQNAKDLINQVVIEVKEEIDNDQTLTNSEKTIQENNVNKNFANIENKITDAINAQGIVDVCAQGIEEIRSTHVHSDVPLSDQVQGAKDQIDQEVVKVKGEINSSATLISSDKVAQKAKVDVDAQVAKDSIELATNAQGVQDALKEAVKVINADHVPGTSLNEQKQSAKEAISQEVRTITAAISVDDTLIDTEKESQTAAVTADEVKTKNNIDKATSAQAIIVAIENGINSINNDYQSNNANLDQQCQDAKDRIDFEASKVKNRIKKDSSLDSKVKVEQIAAVDVAVTKTKNNIDASINAESIKTVCEKGIVIISSKHVTNLISLTDQKQYAKQLIRGEAAIVREEINNDKILEESTKTDQINAVEAQKQRALDKVNKAADAQTVQDEIINSVNIIHSQHLSGNDLAMQKQAAQNILTQEIGTIKKIITNDTSLSDTAKTTQIGKANSELQKSQNAIGHAKDTIEISNYIVDGIKAISAQHIEGEKLQVQKDEAIKVIADTATAVKNSIEQVKNILDAEKQQTKRAVDDVANEAKRAVKSSNDAQSIIKNKVNGVETVNAAAKNIGLAELSLSGQNTKNSIISNQSLTGIAKTKDADIKIKSVEAKEKQVDSKSGSEATQSAINQADRVAETEKVKAGGLATIVSDQETKINLDSQKAAANDSITKVANEVKNKAAQDSSLTASEVASADQQADAAITAAKKKIAQAKSTEAINQALISAIAQINSAAINTESLKFKTQAKEVISNKSESIKEKVDYLSDLGTAEKKSVKHEIDRAVQNGNLKIDSANDSQVIRVVFTIQETIDSIVSKATSIDSGDSLEFKDTNAGSSKLNDLESSETDIEAAESSELKAENTNSNSTKANDLELVETDIKAAESSELKAENTNSNSTKANDLELVETDIKAAESSELKAENTNGNSTKANDLELVETDIKAAESSELKAENTNGNSTKANDLELVETDIKAAESNELKSEDTDSILPKSDDFESNYSDSGSLELNSYELTSAKNSDSRNLEFLGNTAKAFVDKETLDTSKAIEREIMHDSYFYNGEGKRANLMVAQKGSVFSTYGTEIIGGREFYLIDNGLYIAANNVNAQKRILLKNSFVYNKEGKRIGSQLLKRNTEVDTYGDPVRFDDKEFYTIDVNRYVKAVNFGTTNKEVNETLADGVVANAVLNHSARLYNSEGQQKDQVVLSVGSRVATGETRNINGRMFIEIGDNQYLDSDELTGTSRVLTTKADVYNNTGKRIGKVTISVGDNIRTYGEVTIIQGKAYYSVGNGQFVKQTAFE